VAGYIPPARPKSVVEARQSNVVERQGEESVRSFYERNPYPDLGVSPKNMGSWIRPIFDDLRRRPKVRYLEAGCGTGHGVVGMALQLPEWEYHAIDLSGPSIEMARKLAEIHGANITFHCGSYLDPFPFDGDFDVISCAGTIHHSADPDAALRNLLGYLKGNGYLLLHLYGKELDREKFKIKEILSIIEPDLGDYDRRFRLYRELMAKRHRSVLDYVIDASIRSIYRDVRALLRNAWRRAKGVSWSPPWNQSYPRISAPWVDHFCHPLEHAYDIPEVESLAKAAGLEVVSMLGQGREDMALLPPEWRADYEKLDQWSKWRLMELLLRAPASVRLIGRGASPL
jgi:SAM-dependent methyltransferase